VITRDYDSQIAWERQQIAESEARIKAIRKDRDGRVGVLYAEFSAATERMSGAPSTWPAWADAHPKTRQIFEETLFALDAHDRAERARHGRIIEP